MLINDKLLNNVANFYFRKNERLKDSLENITIDYLSLKFQIKIVDNTLNLKELIQNCKNNNHNDHIVPKVYGVAETKLKDKKISFLINQPIEGKYLSQINLSNLAYFKKIVILINYVTLLENINKEKLFFNFTNIIVNKKFELKYVGNPMNSYQHLVHLMANKFKKNNTHSKKTSINQFIDLVIIMFPYLKYHTLFNINDIINNFNLVNKENAVAHLRTFLLQILFDVIETEKGDINKLFENNIDDLSEYSTKFYVLLAIKKLLSEYADTLKKLDKKDRNKTIHLLSSNLGENKNAKHPHLMIKQEVNLNILSKNANKNTLEITNGIRITFKGNENNTINYTKKEISQKKITKRKNLENYSMDLNQQAPDTKLNRLNEISGETKENTLPAIPIALRINNRHIQSNGESYIVKIKPRYYGSNDHLSSIESNKNSDRPKIFNENTPKIFKSVNLYFPEDPKIDKNEINIINTKLYLNYKKKPLKDKKYIQNTINLKNSMIREISGKRNIKNILQEHSSFNIGFLNKLISNRSSIEEHNIFEQKNTMIRNPRDMEQLVRLKHKK